MTKSKKKIKIPQKQTLNLLVREKTLAHPTRLIPILLLIALGAGLFAKFAVIARLDKVKQAEAELAELQNILDMTQNAYADYDEVEEEYNKYTYENFDRSLFDRIEILEMIKRRLFPVCTVQSLNISHNNGTNSDMLSLTVTGPTLQETYALVTSLMTEPMVDDVNISSYVDNSDNNSADAKSTVVMTITLIDATTLDEKLAAIEEAQNMLAEAGLGDGEAASQEADGDPADVADLNGGEE